MTALSGLFKPSVLDRINNGLYLFYMVTSRSKWFFHPILILIFSILALGASLFLYIYWYIEVSTGLKALINRFNLDAGQVLASQTWVVIVVLSVLMGIIFMGIFIIFVYNQKTLQLYRMQYNFINSFTHELKTPVTSLKLYLETFLKHDISREEQIKYIRYMIQDVGRLSDNISRILNLAQLESKSYRGEFVKTNLVLMVERFCKNNIHLFQKCNINTSNSSGRTFFLKINRPFFEMLLMNILTNAIRYNDSPTPEIDIEFESGIRKLYIHFKDNGIGIAQSEQKRVFGKFYQIGRADNMSATGSGIGLYLARIIAGIHKGKILVASEGLGKGSVFTLILPYRRIGSGQ